MSNAAARERLAAAVPPYVRVDARRAMQPGPGSGRLLAALLDRVLADPALNTADQLIAVARGLEFALAR